MDYSILVANGSETYMSFVTEVHNVTISEGVYVLVNKEGELLFSAPIDSVIYISLK